MVLNYKKFLFFMFLFLILAWVYAPGFLKLRKYTLVVRRCKRENKELEVKNKELKKEIWLLENDSLTTEKLGREELGLVKKGEILYKIR